MDERLGFVALVDDQVPARRLNYTLNFITFMSRRNGETVALTSYTLVLVERHQNESVAPAVSSALALELELVFRFCPAGRLLVKSGNLIVHRANEAFVPRLSLEPRIHREIDDSARPRVGAKGMLDCTYKRFAQAERCRGEPEGPGGELNAGGRY